MISVVYCSRASNPNHEKHLKETSGIHKGFEVIEIINNGVSLTECYNEGLKKAKNNIVVFCHDDILLMNKNWGNKILKHFSKNEELGILGVAGSKSLPKSARWWDNPKTMYGRVQHTDKGKTWLSAYSKDLSGKLEDVVLVDGLFFAIHRNRIKKEFDESVEGFHFYDVDFCFKNHLEGVRISVCTDVKVNHMSIGQTNDKWEDNRVNFGVKYFNELPSSVIKDKGLNILITYTRGGHLNETLIIELIKNIKRLGHDVDVYGLPPGGNHLYNKNHIPFFIANVPPGYKLGDGKWSLNNNGTTTLSVPNTLYRVSQVNYDLIHVLDDKLGEHIKSMYPTINKIYNTPSTKEIEDINDAALVVNAYIKKINITEEPIKNNSETPLVSIIIPCYNDGENINDAIESCRNLDYPEKEIIIIDDGSKEDTVSVLKTIDEANPDIKVIFLKDNGGPARARNIGISEANGIYILPHDSDDTFHPSYLKLAVQTGNSNDKLSPIYCDTKHTGDRTGIENRPEWSQERLKQGPFIVCCSLFRRSAWESVGGFDETMDGWEDYDFWWRISQVGFEGKRLPLPLFNYRHIRESVSTLANTKQQELYNHIFNRPVEKKPLKACCILYHSNIQTLYDKRWVDKCIGTILNQTYSNFDLLEINYGGDDYSVLEGFDTDKHNPRLIKMEMNNHAEAMNHLLDKVFIEEDYDICFNVNLDDYYALNRFEEQVKAIHEGYDVVSSEYKFISDNNGTDAVGSIAGLSMDTVPNLFRRDITPMAHPCVCYTKKFWVTYGKYDPSEIPNEDKFLWIRSHNNGAKLHIIKEPLLFYRMHGNQISSTKNT